MPLYCGKGRRLWMHRAGIGEVRIGLGEARGHGDRRSDGRSQQRARSGVGDVETQALIERPVDRVVADQVAARLQPCAAVADVRGFQHQVLDDFALQRDVPLVGARRPAAVGVHRRRSALHRRARSDQQAGIVTGAIQRIVVLDQRLR